VLLEVNFASGEPATYQLVLDEHSGADALDRPAVVRWMFPHLPVDEVEVLGGEQSNTSLVVDGSIIVKVFRRVGPPGERNPDLEVVRALWDHGFRSVAEPLGDFVRADRDLGVARRFLRGAASGWEMALDDPWFMDEVGDLGQVTAQLHVAMAETFGAPPGDAAAWAAAMRSQAARVPLHDGLDANARYDAFAACRDAGSAIRIHGDYHLGQVLHRSGRWYLLDFEGEPARPVAERVVPSSPLRDVAGMLRSFGYAAVVGELPPIWESEARRRFLAGYLAVDAVAALLPGDLTPVLEAFELDKAVYEVGYERASRPDWEHVPMRAVRRLLA
jgi:maltokinase